MLMKIQWLGHATFRIETKGKIIYIDPYVLPKNSPLADMILITHDHFDHLDKGKIGEIRKPGTVFVGNKKTAKSFGEITIIDYWETKDFNGIKVTAVPGYNTNKRFHQKGNVSGFILESEGKRVYHAGDTDLIPEMNKLENIDVALLPIGGTYTMDMEEAVEAALIIRPEMVIPMHYNTIQGTEANPEEFRRMLSENSSILIETAYPNGIEI